MAYDVKFLRGTQAQYDGLGSKDNKTFYYITDNDNFYIGSHQLNNDSLDVSDLALAVENGGVITIKGIKEVDGKIAASTDTSLDISFAKVAMTGAAEDVSVAAIDDGKAAPTQLYPADDAQGMFEAIARDLHALTTESAVTVEQQATAETGYISTYVVKQNGAQVGAKINIPKDYLVKSADVDTVTAADKAAGGKFENDPDFAVGDKYIDFTVNTVDGSGNESHLYINVNELMAALSVEENADEVQLAISATNELSADVVAISATKINYSNSTSGSAVSETVQAALARIDGDDATVGSISKKVKDAIDTLNADVDATTNASVTDDEKVAVVTGVTEVNGVLTQVDSIDVDKAGAATRAKKAVIGTASDTIANDTVKGVKNYIGTIPATADATTIVDYIDEKTGDGVSALDSTADIASVSNNVVTIKGGLVEDDGIVTNAPTSGDGAKADIVLEEVAMTGAAADVSIADANNQFTATTVEDALDELAGILTWGSIA